MNSKKVIGLTGGIASGKSTAAKYFHEAGAYIIDTDMVSRTVAESEEAKFALKEKFPSAFDGNILNRRRLREIVFADPDKLAVLNSVMHPLILRETERQIERAPADTVVVVEAPLLFEAGFDKLADVTVTVSCEESVRIKRLTERDAISEELAKQMVRSQLTDAEREKRADIIISGGGTFAELRAQVFRVFLSLRGA